VALSGCADVEPTGPKLRPDDCLKAMTLATLPAAIQACDAVIRAYPGNPMPRQDRALLLSLQGLETKACRDLDDAMVLTRQQPATATTRRRLADLAVSLRVCPDRTRRP